MLRLATYAGYRGLGILGAGSLNGSDVSLDVGETMTIDFGRLVSNVLLTLVDIDPPGNVTFSFEAFNGLTSLGSFAFPAASVAPEIYNLSTLVGGQDMSTLHHFGGVAIRTTGAANSGCILRRHHPCPRTRHDAASWSWSDGIGRS